MSWIFIKGGPVMYPILLASILGLAIIIEKLCGLYSIRLNVQKFSKEVFALIAQHEFDKALKLCEKRSKHPMAVLFKAGIEKRFLPASELERLLERLGSSEMNKLEKHIGGLISVIGIEPLLGFLGTITGLIRAFMAWEQAGSNITVSALAAGIYEAMITTAAGLIVAVPYYLVCNFIISRNKYISYELSNYSMQLIEVLNAKKG
ncbi:MAG: MotA/TolQ/ExbB proton channel family protein [Candidatus Omnitrophota bacterium]|nr:MotA/TolQ/ExbB proton channel family protein [Candidatus Omnitrophota bacterium]